MAKYTVQQQSIDTLLTWVRTEQIAIPEMQRPFVWTSIKVRDLLDSLYNGYPIGYLITWQSIGTGLKGGDHAAHQQILIDGQQRITAMAAALVGAKVVTKRYKKVRIKISFNPTTEEFATQTPILLKDPAWIADVADVFNSTSVYSFTKQCIEANPDVPPETIETNIAKLQALRHAQVGVITLADELDIETVTEIFIRINSKGTPLSSADFAMSKIASYGARGSRLRKLIDYFCELSVAPHLYEDIERNDREFSDSPHLAKIAWLRHEAEDLYDPTYSDVIRIVGLVGFHRGRVSALVSALSGRDFETRTTDPALIAPSFDRLEQALLRVVSEYDFKQFLMIIKSAGFIASSLIVAKNAVNFAYALYLILREDHTLPSAQVQSLVRRWFVMSMLTGRHSLGFEGVWERDVRRIKDEGAASVLASIEASDMSDAFWQVGLPERLVTSSSENPIFKTFLAAQVFNQTKGFLSSAVTVQAMLEHRGDIHHLVPKDYLVKSGVADRAEYNQVGNYALVETPINLAISNMPPHDYMTIVDRQIVDGEPRIGGIVDPAVLDRNLRGHAIPDGFREVTAESYQAFLAARRRSMGESLRAYYWTL